MDQICRKCGDIGYAWLLVSCNRCKKSSQHRYCMGKGSYSQLRSIEDPELWCCEECGRAPVDYGREACSSKRKKILLVYSRKRKMKVLVYSRKRKREAVSEGDQSRKAKAPRTLCVPDDNDSILNFEASGQPEALLSDTDQVLRRSSPTQAISTSPKVLDQKNGGPAGNNADSSPTKFNSRPTEVGNEENETPRKARDSGCTSHSISEFESITFTTTDDISVLVSGPKEFLDRFSPRVYWKGSFTILDVASHFDEASDLCKEMQAHLPAVTCPKVVDSLSIRCDTMTFELYQRDRVWPKLFQLVPPGYYDIGLYFFPCGSERSKKIYLRFLELLSSKDMAMKAQIRNVELLLFTSNHLPGCSQRTDVETYLWGVFRHIKRKTRHHHIEVLQSGSNPPEVPPVFPKPNLLTLPEELGCKRTNTLPEMDIPEPHASNPHSETNGDNLNCVRRTSAKISTEKVAGPLPNTKDVNFAEKSAARFSEGKMANSNLPIIPCCFSKTSINDSCALEKVVPTSTLEKETSTTHLLLETKVDDFSSAEKPNSYFPLEKASEVPPGFSKLKLFKMPENGVLTNGRFIPTKSNVSESTCGNISQAKLSLEKKDGSVLPEACHGSPKLGPVDNIEIQASKQKPRSLEPITKRFTPLDSRIPVQRACTAQAVPTCLLKHGPSGFLETLATKHQGSFPKSTSKDRTPDPKTREMHYGHHKYTAADLLCSPDSHIKKGLARKNHPSSYAEKKVDG